MVHGVLLVVVGGLEVYADFLLYCMVVFVVDDVEVDVVVCRLPSEVLNGNITPVRPVLQCH